MSEPPIPFPGAAPSPLAVEGDDIQENAFDVRWDARVVSGLLEACRNRAGEAYANVALNLLRGYSRTMAAVSAGIPQRTLNDRCLRDSELAETLQACEEMGYSRIEVELYRRAFAGSSDRGSIRALEMVAKSRGPQYREKYQVQHEHIIGAERATAAAMAVLDTSEGIDDEYESN